MTGSKHVTEKQLASGAAVAVRPLPYRIDIAGSEIPVTRDGVFCETNPFCRTAPCNSRIDVATAYAIMENGTGREVGMGRVTASELWILLCGCLTKTI